MAQKHPDDETSAFFAHLGGTDLSHSERDLHRACSSLYGFDLQPWFFTVRAKHPETEEEFDFQLAALAPHEVFFNLHSAGRQFEISCLGTVWSRFDVGVFILSRTERLIVRPTCRVKHTPHPHHLPGFQAWQVV